MGVLAIDKANVCHYTLSMENVCHTNNLQFDPIIFHVPFYVTKSNTDREKRLYLQKENT